MASVLKQRISGVDTVRAFAALSVMFAHILGPVLPDMLQSLHFGFASYGKYIFTGHPAVIAFFVVSGFCIHYPYTSMPLVPRAFLAARWLRIMIPALVALYLAHLAHLPKYNFIDGFILWSIVCELIYYTLYPFFYNLSRLISWKTQFIIALIISFVLVIHLGSDEYGNAHKYGPMLNWLVALPAWLIGCVLAENIASGKQPANRSNMGLKRFGVALTASILYWLTLNTPLGFYLTMNVFSILIYFWLAAEIDYANQGVTFFESIGKWSYSIYLFHMIFFNFFHNFLLYLGAYRHFLAIPIILLASYGMYRLVEQPAHQLARNVFNKLRA